MQNDPLPASPKRQQLWIIRTLILLGVVSAIYFAYWFFQPSAAGHPLLYGLLTVVIGYNLLKTFNLWYYYWNVTVPDRPPLKRPLSVDVLTTYYPGEPYEMVIATLEAIRAITYPHITYLCDEANDPYLIETCERLGVIHVTRDVRTDAKAGNINNALRQATGEICLVLDPDHIPRPDFLDWVVPHFQNERVGFVQVVQSYYNRFDTLVTKGAAQQTFHFYGPMMMTMHAYGSVNAIGANCTFRRAALDGIGGHAPGLAEDMHTAMLLYAAGWDSVYVPVPLSEGLVPSTLDAYYKQQLKWSRGTFELLYRVLPRIWSKLTGRRRLHYALSTIHYLCGLIYLIGFLIPILSLFMAEAPWRGDILFFIVIWLPYLMSGFIIRYYIQQWLIRDNERGFHIVGGVLEINTWWVYLTGLVYTVLRKKVPYLPTPKDDGGAAPFSLLLPNLVVAGVSLVAVVYGLSRDFSPYSLIMSAFALLTAAIMLSTVYMAGADSNRIGHRRKAMPPVVRRSLRIAKRSLLGSLNAMTRVVRATALPLALVTIVASAVATVSMERAKWATVETAATPQIMQNVAGDLRVGLFIPADTSGVSKVDDVLNLEQRLGARFSIISSYLAWGDGQDARLSTLLADADRTAATPMITWEPWVSTFDRSAGNADLMAERNGLRYIHEGYFDDYLISAARRFKDFAWPVYLRFAHEFDNPDYPWSPAGGNKPADFMLAWRHVHDLFLREGVTNVAWVWNPWKSASMESYWPGRNYVDYVGLTTLNYGPALEGRPRYGFSELYAPFKEKLDALDAPPVILTEFASVGSPELKKNWVTTALEDVRRDHPEIEAVVFFNSAYDRNVPGNVASPAPEYLDWSISRSGWNDLLSVLNLEPTPSARSNESNADQQLASIARIPPPLEPITGVYYYKLDDWSTSRYPLAGSRLEDDFARIAKLGFTAVCVRDPGIYRTNLFRLAEQFGLKVIYRFHLPGRPEQNERAFTRVEQQVLATVEAQRDRPAIQGWVLEDEVLTQPTQTHRRKGGNRAAKRYLEKIGALVRAIKTLDDRRPILLSVSSAHWLSTGEPRAYLREAGVDAFSLVLSSGDNTKEGLATALTGNAVAAKVDWRLSANAFASLPRPKHVLLNNFQNRWQDGLVTTDGYYDFSGRPTDVSGGLATRWLDLPPQAGLPTISIIKPAEALVTGRELTYHATYFREGVGVFATEDPAGMTFEWSLIKCDPEGKFLAIKQLEPGPTLLLNTPEGYDDYRLRLTAVKEGVSRSVAETLNVGLR